jgi:hypothetical protein
MNSSVRATMIQTLLLTLLPLISAGKPSEYERILQLALNACDGGHVVKDSRHWDDCIDSHLANFFTELADLFGDVTPLNKLTPKKTKPNVSTPKKSTKPTVYNPVLAKPVKESLEDTDGLYVTAAYEFLNGVSELTKPGTSRDRQLLRNTQVASLIVGLLRDIQRDPTLEREKFAKLVEAAERYLVES